MVEEKEKWKEDEERATTLSMMMRLMAITIIACMFHPEICRGPRALITALPHQHY